MMLRSLLGIVAVALSPFAAIAFGTFAAANEPKWVTYRSPSGFYSLEYPSDWRVERDDNIVNIIPRDESGAVTMSAYIGAPRPGQAEQIISEVFAAQQPTTPLLTVAGSGWKGVRRTFLDRSTTPNRELVVIIATSADGMAIVTINEILPKIAARTPVYERILQSLQLSTPRR